MDTLDGLLSLKWNNHSSSFIRKFAALRSKGIYCDATIICEGMYFTVHKLILSTCSDYFSEIFENIECKHPFLIIKDIDPSDMEILLNYMYKGEVTVLQKRLPNLIKAAEALKVKGLAVPDDESSSPSKIQKDNYRKSILIESKELPIYSKKRNETQCNVNSSVPKKIKVTENENATNIHETSEVLQEEKKSISRDSPFLENLLKFESSVKSEPEDVSQENFSDIRNQDCMDLGHNSLEMVNSDHSNQSSFDDQLPKSQCSSWFDDTSTTGSRTFDLITTARPSEDLELNALNNMSFSSNLESSSSRSYQSLNLKQSQCPHCSYATVRMDHLQRHINFKHLFIRPFPCIFCSKSFGQKSDLLRHHKIHDKLKNTTLKDWPC